MYFLISIGLLAATDVGAFEKIIGVSISNLLTRSETEISALKASIEAQGDQYVILDAQSSAEKQRSDVAHLIEQGASAIIIIPQDPGSLDDLIESAISKGIPIVSYETPIANPDVFHVAYDIEEAGRIQARALLEVAPTGSYVFMNGQSSDLNAEFLRRGQMDVLGSAIARGDIQIVGDAYVDGWRPENAQRQMEQILTTSDSRVDAVLTAGGGISTGVSNAIIEFGYDEIFIAGQGEDAETLNRVARGLQTASVWRDERELARLAARVSSELANGTQFSEISGVEQITIDRSGDLINTVLLDPIPITQENLNIAVEAGWIDVGVLCKDAGDGAASICRSLETNLPVVDVCFGSDRIGSDSSGRIVFSDGRASALELGFARVSIPEDVHEFGSVERPEEKRFLFMSFGVEAEDPRKHFLIQEIETLSASELSERAAGVLARSKVYKGHVLVYIHGFNVDFDEAIYSAAQISWDIGFDGLPCIYSWPSKGELSLTAYNYDVNSAQQARTHLAEFLSLVSRVEGADHISIIAHSMGNLALVEALRALPAPTGEADKIFSEIVLAAPDVDRDNFISLSETFPRFASGVTLYASANDRALEASKSLAATIPRAGDVPVDGPLTAPFIDSIDASSVSNYVFGLNHSYFASDRSVVSDIGRLILRGERPPNHRTTSLRMVEKVGGGKYWRFPQ
ncbi:alpha/beta hydrolase [Gemmobacter denitrificans]|uniref:Alpha/beta hydrolase n=1 Tax=Gemmobacter denitrificans TaxID=3123040 RepID=A0ABU8C064_9RHOB